MDIDSNFSAARASGTSPLRRTTRSTKVLTDGSIFTQLPALQQTLENLPESRPEAVLRAKELIADSEYPPDQTQQTLALHLAIQLTDENYSLPS
jgi:hypothetical protein